MLRQRSTRMIFKQIFEHGTDYRSLKTKVTNSFYDNYEAIVYFIQYLRNRHLTVDKRSESYGKFSYGPPQGMYFKVEAPTVYDFLSLRLQYWWKRQKENYQEYVETEQYKKFVTLGPDLAAAKFVLECGGKIRFKDNDEWLDKTKRDKILKLPEKYDESYVLEELDLSEYPLRYEHLYFIFNLYYLKTLSFKGCETINDWFLDKISAEYPNLEQLDVSECKNVTERGLEALYRMPNLKKLIITNYRGTAAFDLTCFMLEEVNPFLTCQVQQPKYKTITDK
ncbi:hypothetical protein E2986_01463 [Frieseomelitta varia]|uniref:Distal membrane arm assembly complex 2-like protein n=1 Tax=Frieseomelitta varia TaxID=561572 RepID=A0A833VKL6_9HYME|nr:distal membrane-arm assembly complex protein 2 [Frieseomelitta varia]KAF3421916.1 hypothetical protein E2986_01463 [Frieseomelitta varia]